MQRLCFHQCHGPQTSFCAFTRVLRQVRVPHEDIGCWWTLYDYGLDVVKTWPRDYVHPYPGAEDMCVLYLCGLSFTW